MSPTRDANTWRQVDDLEDEYPVDPSTVDSQIPFAIKAVVVHRAED